MERKIFVAICLIAIGAILLIVATQLFESVAEAVKPIVSPFPYGFTGIVLIGIGSLALGILEWLNKNE